MVVQAKDGAIKPMVPFSGKNTGYLISILHTERFVRGSAREIREGDFSCHIRGYLGPAQIAVSDPKGS